MNMNMNMNTGGARIGARTRKRNNGMSQQNTFRTSEYTCSNKYNCNNSYWYNTTASASASARRVRKRPFGHKRCLIQLSYVLLSLLSCSLPSLTSALTPSSSSSSSSSNSNSNGGDAQNSSNSNGSGSVSGIGSGSDRPKNKSNKPYKPSKQQERRERERNNKIKNRDFDVDGNMNGNGNGNGNGDNSSGGNLKDRDYYNGNGPSQDPNRDRDRDRDRDKKVNMNINMNMQQQQQWNMNSPSSQKRKNNSDFLIWCQATLGIQTLLNIQDFEYIDHLEEWKYQHRSVYDDDGYRTRTRTRTRNRSKSMYTSNNKRVNTNQDQDLHYDHDHDQEPDQEQEQEQYEPLKTKIIRGLAATRNIHSGEILMSVPYHALITLHTTIDHDPVLSQILGPAARAKNGWMVTHRTTTNGKFTGNGQGTGNGNGATSYYEIALLIVALLYHASLGRLSPLWFYVETLMEAPVDSMPYLWTEERMSEEFSGDYQEEVKKIARGIKRDIGEMYNDVMGVLIEEHGEIFEPPPQDANENTSAGIGENGWMFSYDRFEWAFAMVNSRHWHLPLQDLDEALLQLRQIREDPDPAGEHSIASAADAMNMPANQPTDTYVSLHDEALKREDMEDNFAPAPTPIAVDIDVVTKHSFMAPLADFFNFGPPCARGQYNTVKKAFEVVATCPFQKGQEVTFWYSDDCDDVIIANYGFTHPMVPHCPTIEDWKYRSEKWKDYAESLENALSEAYEDLYETLQELKDCNCDVDNEKILYSGTEAPEVKTADDRLEEMRTGRKGHQKSNHAVRGNRRTKLRSLEEERDEIGL